MLLVTALLSGGVWAAPSTKRIALIGGPRSEGPARHEYPEGVRVLKQVIESSPDLRGKVKVEAYPDGWPADLEALEGVAAMVWYFDGVERHPLLDRGRRARVARLMARGVGIVALHQASTVPVGDTTLGLERWLGAARHGMFDRATQDALLEVAAPRHPVTRGVKSFELHDEFYPTFRRAAGGRTTTLLRADLRAEFREGKDLAEEAPVAAAVAWVHERPGGGRAFTYSGAHYLAALDEPALRTLLLNAVAWTARLEVPSRGVRSALPDIARRHARARTDTHTFHRDARRTGWSSHEPALAPQRMAAGFGPKWESPLLDDADGQPPRLYASPLYVDQLKLAAGAHAGRTFSVVVAASNAGYVYAINAFAVRGVPAGAILWRTRLGAPCRLQPAPLDGVPTGVLSTPVIDIERGRLYVTHCDPLHRWRAYALDLASGALVQGWPVALDEATLNAVNRNAAPPVPPTRRHDFRVQRGALNLSPEGAWLYVTFGETETGWIVAVDTANARVSSAFASQATPHRGGGGIWGAGGAAVDGDGHVFVATGTGYNGFVDRERDWTQSVLKLSHDAAGFVLRGTYTPFNHCATATADIDLGSGGPLLIPAVESATAELLAVGGKQGNVYLLDRARLPGRLDRRPACGGEPGSDASLLPPEAQPQFAGRGPLNVFGPYSENDGAMDVARARSVPAYFRADGGRSYLFVTGNTRKAEGSHEAVPPSLVRLEIVAVAGKPAHLRIDQREMRHVFGNPGSPFVTSDGGRGAIVWVLDENARRSASLAGPDAPRPLLYAFDALTLDLLWKSAPGELATSGKYNEPAFARGTVFVGTDRIQAFGFGARGAARAAAQVVPATEPPARRTGPARDAAALYAERCAACHEQPQGNVPPREVLARRSHAQIVDALAHGAMRPFAAGFSDEEIEALARYLR